MSELLGSMFQNDTSRSPHQPGRALRALAAGTVLAIVGCGESSTGPTQANPTMELPPISAAMVAASTANAAGVENFHFLPPIAPEPEFTGTFDPMASPEVVICQLDGDTPRACAMTVATFTTAPGSGSETIRVDADEEHYVVNWHTSRRLDRGEYRISVSVDGSELGYADVTVVANGKDAGVKRGRTLPIKFWIEEIGEQEPTVWDALIAYWPADGTAEDVVSGDIGTLLGNATYASGVAGQAFSFDGSIVSGEPTSVRAPFSYDGPFTLALWAKTDNPDQPAFTGVFASADGIPGSVSPTFQVDLDDANNYRVRVGQTEGVSLGAITPGVFQHIAVTWDGTTVRTYLNGSPVGSLDFILTIDLVKFGTNRGGGLPFSGLVDEVQIFDRDLTEVEIQEVCNAISAVCG